MILGFIFITLVVYSVERLLYVAWNWSFFRHQDFADILLAFVHAWRFDLSAICLLAALPFLLSLVFLFLPRLGAPKVVFWILFLLFVALQTPTMILNLGDAEFVNFLGRRYTFDALFFFRELPGKFWSLVFFYWPLALTNTLIYGLYVGMLFKGGKKVLYWQKKISQPLLAFVGLLIVFLGLRGGLQAKPLNFVHAQIFLNPAMNNLVLNSSFTFLQTITRKTLPRDHYFESQQEMLQWVKRGISDKSLLEGHRPVGKPNIVLIILESFSLEYMGKPHQGQGYTPFLDSLAAKSLFFTNHFANARRSIEGIGAIMGGVPALMNEPFISSQYLTNYFVGLGSLLQAEGYQTSFFHGAQNGSMYFDQFMKSAGMKNYYGKNEYPRPEETDGTWGIWDEPFLQWMSEKLSQSPQPFFSAVFTLTSHNPFAIPPQYAGQFPQGTLDIHESIGYTDYALKKFFESAAHENWFQNTIFIITADHTYKIGRPEYDNEMGHYRVPLLIYSPGFDLPKVDTGEVVQHVDIMPTILDLVGSKNKERNYLGNSVFVPGDRFAINFTDSRYLFITKDYFLQYHRDGDVQMFSMQDANEKKPLETPAETKRDLTLRMKAVLQYFSQGLWDNKLYYPSGSEQ